MDNRHLNQKDDEFTFTEQELQDKFDRDLI